MSNDSLLELMYQALEADFGLIIYTNNYMHTKAAFYKLRKTDPALRYLSFVRSRTAPETEAWIVRRPNGKPGPGEENAEPEEG